MGLVIPTILYESRSHVNVVKERNNWLFIKTQGNTCIPARY